MLGQGWQKLNGFPRVSPGVESLLLGWSTCEEMWGLDRDVTLPFKYTSLGSLRSWWGTNSLSYALLPESQPKTGSLGSVTITSRQSRTPTAIMGWGLLILLEGVQGSSQPAPTCNPCPPASPRAGDTYSRAAASTSDSAAPILLRTALQLYPGTTLDPPQAARRNRRLDVGSVGGIQGIFKRFHWQAKIDALAGPVVWRRRSSR